MLRRNRQQRTSGDRAIKRARRPTVFLLRLTNGATRKRGLGRRPTTRRVSMAQQTEPAEAGSVPTAVSIRLLVRVERHDALALERGVQLVARDVVRAPELRRYRIEPLQADALVAVEMLRAVRAARLVRVVASEEEALLP